MKAPAVLVHNNGKQSKSPSTGESMTASETDSSTRIGLRGQVACSGNPVALINPRQRPGVTQNVGEDRGPITRTDFRRRLLTARPLEPFTKRFHGLWSLCGVSPPFQALVSYYSLCMQPALLNRAQCKHLIPVYPSFACCCSMAVAGPPNRPAGCVSLPAQDDSPSVVALRHRLELQLRVVCTEHQDFAIRQLPSCESLSVCRAVAWAELWALGDASPRNLRGFDCPQIGTDLKQVPTGSFSQHCVLHLEN
jgi:hypothetical protein